MDRKEGSGDAGETELMLQLRAALRRWESSVPGYSTCR